MSLPPGRELDLLVCEAIGIISCNEWVPYGRGQWLKTCVHADGACYPEQMGPPAFSNDDSPLHLRLRDFPDGTLLRKNADDFYTVIRDGHGAITGTTEAHALRLALPKFDPHPRFSADNLWDESWKQIAVERGLLDREPNEGGDLPSPWTPELVCCLGQALSIVSRAKIANRALSVERVQKWLWKLSEGLQDDQAMSWVSSVLEQAEGD